MADKKAEAKKEDKQEIQHQLMEKICVWSRAGVINDRDCDHHEDCRSCLFDLGIRMAVGPDSGEAPVWKEHLRRHFKGVDRPCLHVLLGRIDGPKLCTFNYECHHCPFDQLLDEMDDTASRAAAGIY